MKPRECKRDKALHRTAIPRRSIAAGELSRYPDKGGGQPEITTQRVVTCGGLCRPKSSHVGLLCKGNVTVFSGADTQLTLDRLDALAGLDRGRAGHRTADCLLAGSLAGCGLLGRLDGHGAITATIN